MENNYYYLTRIAAERQREVLHDLAISNLLRGGQRDPLTAKQARRLVLRIAPAVIVMAILLINFLR